MDEENSEYFLSRTLVQKYGGATLADPKKIRAIAQRIKSKVKSGHYLVVVVSAMGKTTNSLIDLAHEVANRPQRRELDMLLTVGERISMALVSLALNDLDCPAISFTGSQAGILTNGFHVNALIQDVKAFRVKEALSKNKVAVLAGFQGVNPIDKEITTLGRGGSDTSAVAMAAYLKADRCEILKDVPGVFTGDPNKIPRAQLIPYLSYDQLLEMTFWGAQVMHYRAVELAKMKEVTIFIGPANEQDASLANQAHGSIIGKGLNMYETSKALAINTHSEVVLIEQRSENLLTDSIKNLWKFFETQQIPYPQLLWSTLEDNKIKTFLTGPKEILLAIKNEICNNSEFNLGEKKLATIALTCTGVSSPEITEKAINELAKENIQVEKIHLSAMSIVFLIRQDDLPQASKILHNIILI